MNNWLWYDHTLLMYVVRSSEFTLSQTIHVCRQGIIACNNNNMRNPSLHHSGHYLVSLIFGTTIPTSFNILVKCFFTLIFWACFLILSAIEFTIDVYVWSCGSIILGATESMFLSCWGQCKFYICPIFVYYTRLQLLVSIFLFFLFHCANDSILPLHDAQRQCGSHSSIVIVLSNRQSGHTPVRCMHDLVARVYRSL